MPSGTRPEPQPGAQAAIQFALFSDSWIDAELPAGSPVPPKQLQPGPREPESTRRAAATCDGSTRKRMTWWTTFGTPGSIRAEVTKASSASFGSSRKQR